MQEKKNPENQVLTSVWDSKWKSSKMHKKKLV